jgi:hypothetical protein
MIYFASVSFQPGRFAQGFVDPRLPTGATGLEMLHNVRAEPQRDGNLLRGLLRAAGLRKCGQDFGRQRVRGLGLLEVLGGRVRKI